jgi:phosphoribosylaminoimidazole-succinocarboxamide synthase
MRELVGQGSNKNIYKLAEHPQYLLFEFSSRISVFDVGALPYEIPLRDKNLERFALAVAQHLQSCGVPQAWDAELSQQHKGYVQRAVAHEKFPAIADTDLIFIPLEVILRWGVPVGSSLAKDPQSPHYQAPNTRFQKAKIDYTTKLESQDRPLSFEEAQSLCPQGVVLEKLENFVMAAAAHLKEFLHQKGLEIWDVKFELAWDSQKKQFLLVDALTPDEMRLTFKGIDKIPLSKELLRFWLRQTYWYEELALQKKSNVTSWKKSLQPPPTLGPWRTQFLSRLYLGLAELLTNSDSKELLSLLRGEGPRPRVCVLGSGGRELALRWRLEKENCEITSEAQQADAVFVSLDADLAAGVADALRAESLWVFGPSQKASRLEWSKIFGREVAVQAQVPCPRYSINKNDFTHDKELPVIKMDALAAGKGVFLAETQESFDAIISDLEKQKISYYFEERCAGPEASVFFVIERDAWGRVVPRYLGSAKDFKRRFLGDEGPNTGGMGAYAPHPDLEPKEIEIFKTYALQTALEMEKRGEPYRGILYLGLMKDRHKGWVLIEYNARFGDPETQALVQVWSEEIPVARSLLQLSPLTQISEVSDNESRALCLSLVHPEYPKACEALDLPTWKPEEQDDIKVFLTPSRTGRIAYMVGKGATHFEAGDRIFDVLLASPWKDILEWRTDILR